MLPNFETAIDENGSVDLIELRRAAAQLQAQELKRFGTLLTAKISNLFSFGATRHA